MFEIKGKSRMNNKYIPNQPFKHVLQAIKSGAKEVNANKQKARTASVIISDFERLLIEVRQTLKESEDNVDLYMDQALSLASKLDVVTKERDTKVADKEQIDKLQLQLASERTARQKAEGELDQIRNVFKMLGLSAPSQQPVYGMSGGELVGQDAGLTVTHSGGRKQ